MSFRPVFLSSCVIRCPYTSLQRLVKPRAATIPTQLPYPDSFSFYCHLNYFRIEELSHHSGVPIVLNQELPTIVQIENLHISCQYVCHVMVYVSQIDTVILK